MSSTPMRNVRHLRPWAGAALLVGAFALAATSCSSGSGGAGGSSGTGGSGNSGCFDYSNFDGMTPAVHFQADVLPIFRQSCGLSMSCHGSETPQLPAEHYLGPSMMDPAPTAAQIQEILAGIVGVKSQDEPEMDVVAAGDPAHSFMMFKLDGDPNDLNGLSCSELQCAATMNCLLAMPSGGPQLPATERDTIRRWIAQGAQND